MPVIKEKNKIQLWEHEDCHSMKSKILYIKFFLKKKGRRKERKKKKKIP